MQSVSEATGRLRDRQGGGTPGVPDQQVHPLWRIPCALCGQGCLHGSAAVPDGVWRLERGEAAAEETGGGGGGGG